MDQFCQWPPVNKGIINGALEVIAPQAESASRVALRVEVYQQGFPFRGSEAGREIDRRGGLPDAAFLVGDADDSCHRYPRLIGVNLRTSA